MCVGAAPEDTARAVSLCAVFKKQLRVLIKKRNERLALEAEERAKAERKKSKKKGKKKK